MWVNRRHLKGLFSRKNFGDGLQSIEILEGIYSFFFFFNYFLVEISDQFLIKCGNLICHTLRFGWRDGLLGSSSQFYCMSYHWKTFCKSSFPHFSLFGSTKKTYQWKTIFNQRKILIKIRLIFHMLFFKYFFLKTISLSR